ncbi:hypothetical protein K8O68_05595 [Salipaludibacillus sp. CUR1]|uniref:hypothetical protein n=1 Tax=Salipaludibacillus sp. CUR1 TaxID=2820003 RepID=UPI001E2EA4EF|nr:hypothetical protein [Salipaludibacillus sp. CUR1]MCE7791893.1 hypothetical protein [Salipaludibacillus sp. CUR1]
MSNSNVTHGYNEGYGNINNFKSLLEEKGFVVQEGLLRYEDILKLCSLGIIEDCFGNHAGAPYALYLLPPAPNQNPSKGQRPPKGYDPQNPDNYPANIAYLSPGANFKLRPDEAIVLVGKTPPPAYYFSFRSYISFVQNEPEKDYSDYLTVGNEEIGEYHRLLNSLGDQVNNFNIWTEHTQKGTLGNPYSSSTVIITTADRKINEQMRETLEAAGFSPDIMNNDNIPIGMVNMGLEKGRDHFMFAMRAIVFHDPAVGKEYLTNLKDYVKVFRISPKTPVTHLSPWPITTLKRRETYTTEFEVLPHARNELTHLRNEIIKKYGSTDYDHTDLKTDIWIVDGYTATVMDVDTVGDNRDASYFRSETFQLTSDDDFIILYGVNHEQTGKAVINNASFYGEEHLNGVAVAQLSVEFKNSASDLFPQGYENEKYYYVSKMSRKNDGKSVPIPYSTGNPDGKAYGVDNYNDAFIGFRLYVDKEALVGPAHLDVIWDRALLFTKKKESSRGTRKGKSHRKDLADNISIKISNKEIRL